MADQGRADRRTRAPRRGQGPAEDDEQERAAAGQGEAPAKPSESRNLPGRVLTINVPTVNVPSPDRMIHAVMTPAAGARRVLSARGTGLPVYVGLGVLAVADVIDPPLAAATGVGYAVLRRWGPLRPE